MSFRILINDVAKRQIRLVPITLSGVFFRRTFSNSSPQYFTSTAVNSWKTIRSRFGSIRDRVSTSKTANYVVQLQTEAFWQQHRQTILSFALLLSSYCIWSLIKRVWMWWNKGASQSHVNGRSLVLTAVVVLGIYGYMKRRFGVDPDTVYRMAIVQMNTHPGLLEVVGAPVSGSQVRAMVVSGGGLKMKGWGVFFQSRRVKMTFPIMGSRREGIAFLDVKKIQGKYMMKVLGVDIRLPDDQEQRIFLKGDSIAYSKGGVLASLLEPLKKAEETLSLDAQEDIADEAELQRQRTEAKEERRLKRREDAPKSLDKGGGMYLYERVYWWIKERVKLTPFGRGLRVQEHS